MTALLAAACAAIAAWVSIGAAGVIASPEGQLTRVGMLPPVWWLAVLLGLAVLLVRVCRVSSRTASPLFLSALLLLPWIPGPMPAVFLVWTGKVALMVWLAIAVLLILYVGRVRRTRLLVRRTRLSAVAAAVVVCVLYIASAWHLRGILPGGDEPNYLLLTQSILKDGDLQIENNQIRGDYAPYFHGRLALDYLRRGTNGHIYSIHAPGLSVAIAPAFALGGYPGVVVFLSMVAALGGALLWSTAYRATQNAGAAWFAWAVWALTVPFFFQAFSVFPDGFGATLVLFAAVPLIVNVSGDGEIERLSNGRWLATGAALAALPWLHTRFSLIAGALGLFLVLRLLQSAGGRARVPLLLAIPVVGAVAWFLFFKTIYGTFNPAAPYAGYTQSEVSNILTGLPALFLDQQFGILPNAPVYVFGLLGLAMLARERPRLALELSGTAVVYLLSSSAYHMWWGGSSAPARFAIPILPLLALPSAWLWSGAKHRATRAMAIAALLVSLVVTALMVSVDGGRLAYNFRDGFSRLAEWVSPTVDLSTALPSFFRQTSSGAVFRAAVWLVPFTLGWMVLQRVQSRGSLPLATGFTVAAATMIAATGAWATDGVSGLRPDASQLDLLSRVHPSLRPHTVDLRHLRHIGILDGMAISNSGDRQPGDANLLLVPGIVPAGRYRLQAESSAAPAGHAQLVIGRNARPIKSWDAAAGEMTFQLPVNVGSLIVRGDEPALHSVQRLVLRPVQLVPPAARPTNDYAREVEPYDAGLVYFFDAGAFVEQAGFWVRGGAAARIAAAPSGEGPVHLFIRNAAAPNRVTVRSKAGSQVFDLQPREERAVAVEGVAGVALLDISSEGGFHPSDVDRGSTDTRYLGVWVELRQ